MNAPQIIVIAIWLLNLLVYATKDGEYKEQEKYSLAVAVIRILIWACLLTWGGFFPWPA